VNECVSPCLQAPTFTNLWLRDAIHLERASRRGTVSAVCQWRSSLITSSV